MGSNNLMKMTEVNTVENIPIFLRKTYNMINDCDASIATWSEDGLSFVVKNVELFSSRVLCRYFKHNNFSSFARQLNIYSFRKVKADLPPLVTGQRDNKNAKLKYYEFKRENFQRGRLDLLSLIRTSKQLSEEANKSEVEELKMEVKKLRTITLNMTAQLCDLISLVTNHTKKQEQISASNRDTFVSKREEDRCNENQPSPIYNMLVAQHHEENSKTPYARAFFSYSATNTAAAPITSSATITSFAAGSIPSPLFDEFGCSIIEENHYPLNEEEPAELMDYINFNNFS